MKIIGFDKVERSGTHIRAEITSKGFLSTSKHTVYSLRGSCMWKRLDTGEYVSGVHDAYEAWLARESFTNPADPAQAAEAAKAAAEMQSRQQAAAAAFLGIYPVAQAQVAQSYYRNAAQSSQSTNSDMLTGALLGAAAGYAVASASETTPSCSNDSAEVSSGGGGDFGGGGASGEF